MNSAKSWGAVPTHNVARPGNRNFALAWAHIDTTTHLTRTLHGPYTDLLRTFHGPFMDLLRTSHGPRTDLARTPHGPHRTLPGPRFRGNISHFSSFSSRNGKKTFRGWHFFIFHRHNDIATRTSHGPRTDLWGCKTKWVRFTCGRFRPKFDSDRSKS